MFLFTLFLSVSQEMVVRFRRRRGRGMKFVRETASFSTTAYYSDERPTIARTSRVVLSAALVFAFLRPTQKRSSRATAGNSKIAIETHERQRNANASSI